MINEEKTMEMFGYHAGDLKPFSDKEIVVRCDICGGDRTMMKGTYTRSKTHGLCRTCCTLGFKHSDKTKLAMSDYARNRPEEHNRKIGNALLGHEVSDGTRKLISDQCSEEKHWNFGKHHSIETLKLMSDVKIGKMLGADNPNWKGGITSENQKFYHSAAYHELRSQVFERDGFACRKCNTAEDLHFHHILPYRDWKDPQFALNVKNGITLCKKCHEVTYGREYEFFSEFFDLANGISHPTI